MSRQTSQESDSGSQSILVSEPRPSSPMLLEDDSPNNSQVNVVRAEAQDSETFTQHELVYEDDSNDSRSTVNNESNANSSVTFRNYAAIRSVLLRNNPPLPALSSPAGYDADVSGSSSSHTHRTINTRYNSSIVVQLNGDTVHERSNISIYPPPEAQVRKSDDHTDEPPAKVRKFRTKSNEDLEGETCPICLESWSNTGEHRLVALKCGHLFGSQCVERWMKAQTTRERACPTCKTKSSLKDIRNIYARRLVAADSSQITALTKKIDSLEVEKSRVELELQKSKIAHRACVLQLEVLRRTLMKAQAPKEQPVRKSWRFAMEKNLEISKDGGCRVMTYNCRTYELYVSQKSTNNLFPGYGIRKVSCVDHKLGPFLRLHPKPIRDITYSQPRDLLLSVSLDSSARIMERGVQTVTVQTLVPLWSCSWDYLRSNEFYVGGVGGVIQQYDVRNPSTFLQQLRAPVDISPVVSLCSTEHGLLSCQLNSCCLWVANSRQWEPQALPVDGPFMSLCYDNDSHRALVSCRTGRNGERARLAVLKLKASVPSGDILFDKDLFYGSSRTTIMSRAAWVKAPGATWLAAHSESDSMLYLHGVDGAKTLSLLSAEPTMDVCSMQLNGETLLASLSESRLRMYRAVPTNA